MFYSGKLYRADAVVKRFLQEIQRRRVLNTAALYIVAAWLVLQITDLAFPGLAVPEGAIRYIWLACFLGFPAALVFGWRYDLTSRGLELTPPAGAETGNGLPLRPIDFGILAALLLAVSAIIYATLVAIASSRGVQDSGTNHAAVEPHSIAVLPLLNLSEDQAQAFFVEGIHEALIRNLARIAGLKVISRTSANVYRDQAKLLKVIGKELGVASLVEGSVLRSDGRVRISVQLLDAATDRHIWTEDYDRPLENAMDLPREVATAIASRMEGLAVDSIRDNAAEGPPFSRAAYDAYLQGRFHWYKFNAADLALAIRYFREALALDPHYALAHVGLADALATRAHLGLAPSNMAYPEARRLVERALQLQPALAEAHDLLARINFAYDWDWNAAENGFLRAIELNPGFPDVRAVYSQLLGLSARWEESMQQVEQAAVFDPLNPWFQLERIERTAWRGDVGRAFDAITALARDNPGWPAVQRTRWGLAFAAGDLDAARTALRSYYEMIGEPALAVMLRSTGDASDYGSQMIALAQALLTQSTRPHVDPVELAELYAHAGAAEEVFIHLQQALAARESRLVYVMADPVFTSFRNSPQFSAVRERIRSGGRPAINTSGEMDASLR
jgi:TolB-like protein